jgi:uncharacterized protein
MKRRARICRRAPVTTSAVPHIGMIALLAWALVGVTLAGCTAAPPLKLYVLSEGPASSAEVTVASDPAPPPGAPVIEVARVTLPDYMDSRDLVVRQGDLLERSSTGRWARRLSLATTDLVTARLAMRHPDAWVSDQPQARTPDYWLTVHISRLDISSTGTGTVDADWEIVPRNVAVPVLRHRVHFAMSGAVGTDERVARFERRLLERLARAIDFSSLPGAPSQLPPA